MLVQPSAISMIFSMLSVPFDDSIDAPSKEDIQGGYPRRTRLTVQYRLRSLSLSSSFPVCYFSLPAEAATFQNRQHCATTKTKTPSPTSPTHKVAPISSTKQQSFPLLSADLVNLFFTQTRMRIIALDDKFKMDKLTNPMGETKKINQKGGFGKKRRPHKSEISEAFCNACSVFFSLCRNEHRNRGGGGGELK